MVLQFSLDLRYLLLLHPDHGDQGPVGQVLQVCLWLSFLPVQLVLIRIWWFFSQVDQSDHSYLRLDFIVNLLGNFSTYPKIVVFSTKNIHFLLQVSALIGQSDISLQFLLLSTIQLIHRTNPYNFVQFHWWTWTKRSVRLPYLSTFCRELILMNTIQPFTFHTCSLERI